MVCASPEEGRDVRNRGIFRGRIFFGELILVAAVFTWATALLMSPHGQETAAGTEHIRGVVATFLLNSAIGTILLSAFAAWLLFPQRRPRKPWRDYAILALLGLLAGTSLYQLIWLKTAILN
jgi:drug/metabolite transporter (DMT)-like permease